MENKVHLSSFISLRFDIGECRRVKQRNLFNVDFYTYIEDDFCPAGSSPSQ